MGGLVGRPGFGRSHDDNEHDATAPKTEDNSSSSAAASPPLVGDLVKTAGGNQSADVASAKLSSFEDATRRVQQALRRAQELEEALEARLAKSLPRAPLPPPSPPPAAVNASEAGNLTEGNAPWQLRRGEWINEETGLPFSELRKKLLSRPCFKEEQTGLGTARGANASTRASPPSFLVPRGSSPLTSGYPLGTDQSQLSVQLNCVSPPSRAL